MDRSERISSFVGMEADVSRFAAFERSALIVVT
jgi:hypothetical protein